MLSEEDTQLWPPLTCSREGKEEMKAATFIPHDEHWKMEDQGWQVPGRKPREADHVLEDEGASLSIELFPKMDITLENLQWEI